MIYYVSLSFSYNPASLLLVLPWFETDHPILLQQNIYPAPQYIDYLTSTGESSQYEVFLNAKLDKRLVKCDCCAVLIPLTNTDNPIYLRTHRESDQCYLEIRRTLREIAKQQANNSQNEVIERSSNVEGILYLYSIGITEGMYK